MHKSASKSEGSQVCITQMHVPCSRGSLDWRGTPLERLLSLRLAPERKHPGPWWWCLPRTGPRRHRPWPPPAAKNMFTFHFSVRLSHLSEVCEAQCSDLSCSSSEYHVACFHHEAHSLLRLYSSAQACPNGYVNTTSTPNNSEEGADLSTVTCRNSNRAHFHTYVIIFFFFLEGGLTTPSSKSKHVNPE